MRGSESLIICTLDDIFELRRQAQCDKKDIVHTKKTACFSCHEKHAVSENICRPRTGQINASGAPGAGPRMPRHRRSAAWDQSHWPRWHRQNTAPARSIQTRPAGPARPLHPCGCRGASSKKSSRARSILYPVAASMWPTANRPVLAPARANSATIGTDRLDQYPARAWPRPAGRLRDVTHGRSLHGKLNRPANRPE